MVLDLFNFSSEIAFQLHNRTSPSRVDTAHGSTTSHYMSSSCAVISAGLFHCMNLTASELKWQPTRLSVVFSFPAWMGKQEREHTCAYFCTHSGKFQTCRPWLLFCWVVNHFSGNIPTQESYFSTANTAKLSFLSCCWCYIYNTMAHLKFGKM